MRSKIPDTLSASIRIVAIDEQEMFRTGLCLLLSQQKGLDVVGSVSTWLEAMPIVQREQPDIVLLSIRAKDGLEFLPELLAVSAPTKVLALSDSDDQELHRNAARFGASGVLQKAKSAAILVKAIQCVNAGETWLDRSTTASLLRELSRKSNAVKQDPDQVKIASLTEREREVIQLVGKGLKNRQIGEKLFISDITVHHHLTSIYSKLEVADRMELLIYSYRNGLSEIPF
jgi:two-component system, NarL family, nitrate/nitrite response regulator NarL